MDFILRISFPKILNVKITQITELTMQDPTHWDIKATNTVYLGHYSLRIETPYNIVGVTKSLL
jgi:hypothetical protein